MTAPDYAHGYLRIPLAVWRAVYCRGALTRRQLQLVSVIIRESWGWQTARGEPYDWTRPLTHRQLADAAGLSTDHIARDLRVLLASGVLRQRGERYQFVADHRLWITHASAATNRLRAATKTPRDAAQMALVPPGVKKAKKSNRNVAAAVDNSADAVLPSVAAAAERLVAVVASFAGPLAPAEAECLRHWIASDSVAVVWRAIQPLFRQRRAERGAMLHALIQAHGFRSQATQLDLPDA